MEIDTKAIDDLSLYDHLRIAWEYSALALHHVEALGETCTPRLADEHNLAPIRLAIDELREHLHLAIEKNGQ